MHEKPTRVRSSPAQEPWFSWLVWLLGPASLVVTFASCLAMPQLAEMPDGFFLGGVLVLTHLTAGALFAWHVCVPGAHRRSTAFWLLVAYWVGIAAFVIPVAASVDRPDPTVPLIGLWLASRPQS